VTRPPNGQNSCNGQPACPGLTSIPRTVGSYEGAKETRHPPSGGPFENRGQKTEGRQARHVSTHPGLAFPGARAAAESAVPVPPWLTPSHTEQRETVLIAGVGRCVSARASRPGGLVARLGGRRPWHRGSQALPRRPSPDEVRPHPPVPSFRDIKVACMSPILGRLAGSADSIASTKSAS
jgi:hypothetical protein